MGSTPTRIQIRKAHELSYIGLSWYNQESKFFQATFLDRIYVLMLVVVLRNNKVNWKMFVTKIFQALILIYHRGLV